MPLPEAGGRRPGFLIDAPARADRLPLVGLAGLAALQLTLIATHVPWRDELQAVMVAQHSATFGALFGALAYEGHPALWYLLLRALAPLHDPLLSLKLAQAAVAATTITLIWRAAPFRAWTRLAILSSYLLLFEWGVIARSYGLGALLFVAFLAARRGWPAYALLALMANVSAHFFLLSGAALLVLLLIDRRRSLPGLAIWAAGAGAAALTAWPPADGTPALPLAATPAIRALAALKQVSEALIPYDPSLLPPRWNIPMPLLEGAMIGVLVIAAGALAVRREPRAALIYLLLAAGVLAFSMLFYPAFARHTGVLFLLVIGLEWVLAERGRGPMNMLTTLWIGVLVVLGLWIAGWSLALPFTRLPELTAWVRSERLSSVRWAAYPGAFGVDLAAEFGRPYYDPQKQCLAWHQVWNAAVAEPLPGRTLNDRLRAGAAASGGRLLVVADREFDPSLTPDMRPRASFVRGLQPETWWIYEVTAPAGSAVIPDCR